MEQPNLDYINELSAGLDSFKKKLIKIILLELPDEISNYKAHRDNREWQNAAASVHKLKHKISILGMLKAHKMASKHEDQIKSANLELDESFLLILEQMLDFIKEQ